MSIAEMLSLFRGTERLMIVGSATLALYLGYRLFVAGIINKQSGEFSGKSLSIKLINVGPGIFFALFGVCVLVVMISARLQLSDDGTDTLHYSSDDNGHNGHEMELSYYGGQESSRIMWVIEDMSAIKTMISDKTMLSDEFLVAALTSYQKTLAHEYLGDEIYEKCEFGPREDRDEDCAKYDQLIK